MFVRGNRPLMRATGNCDPPGGGHVFTKSSSQTLLTNVNLQSMSTTKEGSSCGAGDKLPVPGHVSQGFQIRKSGSVPQVESEALGLGDVKGEGSLRLHQQSSVQGSAGSFVLGGW